MTTSITPLSMPKRRTLTATAVAAEIADHDLVHGNVRPGLIDVESDGIIKAKQVKPGMEIQSYLHGKPCGSVKVVGSVTRSEDGSHVLIAFSSSHPTLAYKAAYRFYVPALAGTVTTEPGFVPVH